LKCSENFSALIFLEIPSISRKGATSVLHSNRAAAYMMLGWWQQALRDCNLHRQQNAVFKNIIELQRM